MTASRGNFKVIKIRFQALLTMRGEVFENGELVVEEGRISRVLRQRTAGSGEEVLDLSDCLLLPGFVNAHCHLALSALRGRVPRAECFTDWVRTLIEQNAAVSIQERVRGIRSCAEELVRSGVTALGDYMADPELLKDYETLPFRQVVFLETLGFHPSAARKVVDRLRSVLESHITTGERFKLGLAPHAPYSVSPYLFRQLRKLADRYGCPFSSHVAEFLEEVRFLEEGGGELRRFLEERGVFDADWKPPGKSPVSYLDSLGVLDSLVAVHLNHLNHAEEDLARMASLGMCGVFCPGSTRWFGRSRWMPVRELLDRGVAVALGTDSLASNESLNFLRELRLAEEMLPGVSRLEILEMATRGGAAALGMQAGEIVPGRFADLIGFRIQTRPASWADVPFDPARTGVDFTMMNGETVFLRQTHR